MTRHHRKTRHPRCKKSWCAGTKCQVPNYVAASRVSCTRWVISIFGKLYKYLPPSQNFTYLNGIFLEISDMTPRPPNSIFKVGVMDCHMDLGATNVVQALLVLGFHMMCSWMLLHGTGFLVGVAFSSDKYIKTDHTLKKSSKLPCSNMSVTARWLCRICFIPASPSEVCSIPQCQWSQPWSQSRAKQLDS